MSLIITSKNYVRAIRNFSVIICLSVLVFGSGCKSEKKEKEESVQYAITSPVRVDTSFSKDYVAQVQSVKNIEVRAQEKGYLQSINADEGKYVRAGQLLFKIMPKVYEAELFKAQAAVKESELEMLNTKALADKNIVSKTELSIAEAKLDEAKADLSLAQLHLSFTEIKAPFDGVINRIPLKTGSLIDEGALLTTLSDNKSIYAYFNVPENEYLAYKAQGDTGKMGNVSLLLANNELHKYKGNVETIEGEFDNATGNIAFRARFPNPDLLLKHGETGKVRMTVPIHNAIIIPQKATYELQDKVYVFVVDKNNVAKSRSIVIKNRLNDLYVVESGLTENDKILLEGVQSVKDDDKISCKYVDPRNVIASLQLIKE